jgi:hypothetical protein
MRVNKSRFERIKEIFDNLKDLLGAKKRGNTSHHDPETSNIHGPLSQKLYNKMDPSWEARRKSYV